MTGPNELPHDGQVPAEAALSRAIAAATEWYARNAGYAVDSVAEAEAALDESA